MDAGVHMHAPGVGVQDAGRPLPPGDEGGRAREERGPAEASAPAAAATGNDVTLSAAPAAARPGPGSAGPLALRWTAPRRAAARVGESAGGGSRAGAAASGRLLAASDHRRSGASGLCGRTAGPEPNVVLPPSNLSDHLRPPPRNRTSGWRPREGPRRSDGGRDFQGGPPPSPSPVTRRRTSLKSRVSERGGPRNDTWKPEIERALN